jgi:D-arabinose 1-dehydrogenase-like Zn-dependent alcohol dehydrogenase
MATMRAARMYGYKQPLRLEEIPIPGIEPTQVLVKVGGAGMCRTDFQLIDGYFHSNLPLEFPVTPGHEIAGTIAAVGSDVPVAAGLSEGDSVAVFGPNGDGSCRQCHGGNEQICNQGHWVGFGPHGGYQEYVPISYRQAIKVSKTLSPVALAPLTDAGLTPYRGLKKLLATEGAVASVGLVGNRVDVPLFPFVGREFSYFGSFWGNFNDLTEVIALAEAGRIKDSMTEVRFEDVNEHIDALARGDFLGRAVIVYD